MWNHSDFRCSAFCLKVASLCGRFERNPIFSPIKNYKVTARIGSCHCVNVGAARLECVNDGFTANALIRSEYVDAVKPLYPSMQGTMVLSDGRISIGRSSSAPSPHEKSFVVSGIILTKEANEDPEIACVGHQSVHLCGGGIEL